jgi:hypothetical protein
LGKGDFMIWRTIQNTNLDKIKKVRLQLHQACQMLAATGISFVDKEADDSHTNLEWVEELNAFESSPFGSHKQLRLAVNFEDFKLILLDEDHDFSEFELNGKTEEQAITWYKNALKSSNFDPSPFTMKIHYDITETEQAKGLAFDLFDPASFLEFSNHYVNANLLLKNIASQNPGSSPVRCWPHHFDLGMIITVEKIKSIGVGFSPGDDHYDEPYYYVSPWPYPDYSLLNNEDLPGEGIWHITGFVSAILTVSDFQRADNQKEYIEEFFDRAIAISKALINLQ